MITYLLLALADDGRVTGSDGYFDASHGWKWKSRLPVRTGNDRGQYSTFEVTGYSIDVVRLPDVAEVKS